MTKKHFIALADAIRNYEHGFNLNQLNAIADFCEKQNPQFKRERWLSYIAGTCGKNGGKVK